MSNIRPTGHNILIAPIVQEKETAWGFQLNPTESSTGAVMDRAGRQYGTLVAAGPQAWKAHAVGLLDLVEARDPALDAWAKVGDTVMYSRYAGKGVYDPLTGEEYYLLHDEDVLAVLPPHSEWKWNPAEKDKEL
jgi:co-chaperonin GroES (HSP10)